MNICLDENALARHDITLGQMLLLIAISNNINLEREEEALIGNGLITARYNSDYVLTGWRVTNKGDMMIASVILDSERYKHQPDRLVNLAVQLKEIYPEGKKEDTNYYWAEGKALIVRRLKAFFKKYGNDFTDEQIIDATRKYVEGFRGSYKYMKLLKYFIFKEKVGADGSVESESELLNCIENGVPDNSLSDQWTSELS